MRNARPRSAVLAVALPTALTAALLAGCADPGGGGAAGGGEPELGAVELNPATASIALPMDAYTDTEAEAVRMGRVQEGLVSRCMARYGFTYEGPRPAAGATASASGDRHKYLFGLADPAYAAAHGYDKGAGAGANGGNREKPPAPQLSDSAYAVLHGEQRGTQGGGRAPDAPNEEEAAGTDSGIEVGGRKVPPGGCGREAYRKLYAPRKDSVDLLFAFGLASEAHDRSKRDSRVVEVLAKWSACMDKSGYPGIKSPYDVVDTLALEDDKGGAKAVAAATADVACKREVNLVGVWAAVEKAYQERLVDEHAQTLALYEKQRDARFELAASLG
ncbi:MULTISPECIES: hypothetical protein [unclassified Streptomyces]|uniref:hypothetical protein n=1 Tax=unclassified Streptomyces TaxID=2593676 RepID=UPI00225645B8|nr:MULTISPECIES: hypothetical protein [unclassified Streptomyces]MCX4527446.1 hypothetical protein [Streptomyces sp. NBC_01551]MCX4541973.1 hypothetical protein [Streptomyces sp. NBC_01565]